MRPLVTGVVALLLLVLLARQVRHKPERSAGFRAPSAGRLGRSDPLWERGYGTEAAQPGEIRVVFLGDQITEGWGEGEEKFFPGKAVCEPGHRPIRPRRKCWYVSARM